MRSLCKDPWFIHNDTDHGEKIDSYNEAVTNMLENGSKNARSRGHLVLLLVLVMKREEWFEKNTLQDTALFCHDFVIRSRILVRGNQALGDDLAQCMERVMRRAEVCTCYASNAMHSPPDSSFATIIIAHA